MEYALYILVSTAFHGVPTEVTQWEGVMRDFGSRWQFPNVCGALDGKHVNIKCPTGIGSHYYDYKKNFSTILFAVADANSNFLYIDVGTNGRVNDAQIFSKSAFNVALQRNHLNVPERGIFIGDVAFPLRTNLLKPFARCGPLNETERIFNYRLSRARRVVENAFRVLVARFRVYETPIAVNVTSVDKIVKSSCALHNWLRRSD